MAYIPKAPLVLDPDHIKEVVNNNPSNNKLKGQCRMNKGDQVERNVFDAAKEYFSKLQEDVLLIKNLDLIKFGSDLGNK